MANLNLTAGDNITLTKSGENLEISSNQSEIIVSPTEPTTGEEVWLQKGKNLFNEQIITNIAINQSGTFLNTTGSNLQKFVCSSGETFTLKATFASVNVDNILFMIFFDGQGNMLERYPIANQATITMTHTAPANTAYMYDGHYIIKPTTIQLEYGSTATTYEPYIDKKIYTKNDNGVYEEFYNESEMNKETYSTNETRIGTWINNKKLYRKVFEVTPTTTDWNYENHNISNLDKIINCYGYASNSQYTSNRIPLNTYSTSGIDILVQTSRIAFKSTDSNLTNTPWVIVLEYTKTTD